MEQIPLPLVIGNQYSWDNFYVGHNAEVVDLLQREPEPCQGLIYLWGQSGVGKSHLLQATAQQAVQSGRKVFFLDLAQQSAYVPEALENLASTKLICLDNCQSISGYADWERALFNLYNQILETGNTLLISANGSPQNIGIQLADLTSRLQAGLTFYIQPLGDSEVKAAIQAHMRHYGFSGDDAIVDYIAQRTQRNMSTLSQHFTQLDKASLQEQRALTKPFIKKTLAW